MAIRIISDSASDLRGSKDITIIPLSVDIDGKTYRDGVDLSCETFYAKLKTAKDFPKTSQPTPNDFLSIFAEAEAKGDEVICITMSKELSGTFNSATLAKSMSLYDKIEIIDSKCVSGGEQVLQQIAKKMIAEGKGLKEIADTLRTLVEKLIFFAVVDTLEYLYKGGRLSKKEATIGEFLGIKPILKLVDGKIHGLSKGLGINHAIRSLVQKIGKQEIDFNYPIYFVFSNTESNLESFVAKMKQSYPELKDINVVPIGSTIGSHIGPDAFGISYISKTKNE